VKVLLYYIHETVVLHPELHTHLCFWGGGGGGPDNYIEKKASYAAYVMVIRVMLYNRS
jgi:hypothetical protein